MKKYLSLLLLYSINCYSQNLVPNPSFEEYDTCPNSYSQIHFATGWWSANESPDYYNTCATGVSPLSAVPRNGFGYQFPASGEAYIGYYNYGASSLREYIGIELINHVQEEKRYSLGFKISRSDSLNGGLVVSNNFCMWFSNVLHTISNPKIPNNFAHFTVDSFITDTLNWINLSGMFISDSNYRYLYIGNFYDNANTDTFNITSINNNGRAYYYIDDVFVMKDTSTDLIELNNNIIKSYLYDNTLKIENGKKMQAMLYDENGILIYKNNKIDENVLFIDIINITGVFFLIILSASTIIYYRKYFKS